MPKFIVHCDSGFCGVNEDVIVEAEDSDEADRIAEEWWIEQVSLYANVTCEITPENEEEYEGYQEIT